MKKTNFPTRKYFEKDFISSKGKLIFTLKYKQATIQEYTEFIEKTPEKQALELYQILRSQIPLSLIDKIFLFFNKNYQTNIERGIDIEKITLEIMNNRFRGYKSIFDDVKIKKQHDPKKPRLKGSIDQMGYKAVCTGYNIQHKDLLENYTLEQYLWFLDGIEWEGNTFTDEGIMINNEAIKDVEAIKKRTENTRKYFEKK